MIEFLSSGSWIQPQIDFLVFLQNLRISHFEMFNKFFLSVTIFGEIWLPTIVSALIYWCYDSKKGMYLLSLFGFNFLFAQLFKMIACVYRPWILSDKITPVKEAYTYAFGYSCPSGHSATASSTFGGIAYIFRNKKLLSIGLILLVLLVGFSRMWLGVHTPQDVISGLLLGFLFVCVFDCIINWAEKNINRYLYILFAINIFALISLIYVCYFNVYPCDYLNGQMLVDPKHSIYAFIICYGYALGLINGGLLTRRFLPFDAKEGSKQAKIIRGFVGSILVILLLKFGLQYVFKNSLDYKIAFSLAGAIGIIITSVYPILFSRIFVSRGK